MPSRIMVIDDSEDNRRVLGMVLSSEGFQITEASDGEEALSSVRSSHPDLILLDINMPKLDGYEVCRRLKQDSQTASIPVIFLTAVAEAESKVLGLGLGANDYVTKPFDRREIIARIKSHLNTSSQVREATHSNRTLTDFQKQMTDDLNAAAAIQRSLLPQKLPDFQNLAVAWKFLPSKFVAGDIFNVFSLTDEVASFYMVDVSGSGIASAIVTASISQFLQPTNLNALKRKLRSTVVEHYSSPVEVLQTLNEEFPFERFERYFTIAYMVFNTRTGLLQYCSAAHPPAIVLRNDGSFASLDHSGTIIGMDSQSYKQSEMVLEPGESVILYTDGVTDHENPSGVTFGEDRLISVLRHNSSKDISDLLEEVVKSLQDFGPATNLRDDISLLGFRRLDPIE